MNQIVYLTAADGPVPELPERLRESCRIEKYSSVEELPPSPDLIMVDEAGLDNFGTMLQKFREEVEPLYLPMALLVYPDAPPNLPDGRWSEVDDVVVWDPEDPALSSRIGTLLKARELSRLAHEELRQLFDSQDHGICFVDQDHQVVLANKSLVRLLGRDPSQSDEKLCEVLFGTSTCRGHVCPVFRVMDGIARAEDEMTVRARKNEPVQALVAAKTYSDIDGEPCGAIVSIKDLAESKRDEQERIEMLKDFLAIQKDEAIGRLSGSLAHYFNNIMAVIMSSTYFGRTELDEKHPVQIDLQTISEAAERGVAVIDQLVSVGRRQILRTQTVRLADILREASGKLTEASEKEVRVSLDLDETTDCVEVDVARFGKVFLDLLLNAQDNMKEGGEIHIRSASTSPQESKRITRDYHFPGVLVEVSDGGPELEPYEIDRIFDPVFQKQKMDRTGLELSVARGTIEQSGGYITVETTAEAGNTVCVWLPTIPADADQTRKYPPSTRIPGPGRGKTVLVVDDEEMVRAAATRMLRDHGYEVIDADGPEAAIELFGQHRDKVDVLLTDVVMPKMNGKELAEALRADRGDLKVLYMSGYGDDIVSTRGVLQRDVIFLRKPFNAHQLYVAVWDALHVDTDER
jgi:two-component system, cell cycle sensor histidine kinase and response regulator CckA